jgi:N6-L-threonylcarbamoyladenine synthase
MKIFLEESVDTEFLGFILGYMFSYGKLSKMYMLLTGTLGMGKTLVSKGFINFMRGKTGMIMSPSYLLCLVYDYQIKHTIGDGSIIKTGIIRHIDPYRLKKKNPIEKHVEIDQINDDGGIWIIEHPNKAKFVQYLDPNFVINISLGSAASAGSEHGSIGSGRIATIDFGSCFESTGDSSFGEYFSALWLNRYSLNISQLRHTCTSVPVLSTEPSNEHSIVPSIVPSSYVPTFDTSPSGTFHVMGIETSCDDTCVAIVDNKGNIISDIRVSQCDVHEEFGGVNPMAAMEAHRRNIDRAVDICLAEFRNCVDDGRDGENDSDESTSIFPNAISFTKGPGLEICLCVGIEKAHELSMNYKVPIIPTHHLESHIVISRLPTFDLNLEYPFLSVIVSGGHTFVAYAFAPGHYEIISQTHDDSIGETIDKISRSLGITNVPAGPHLEILATQGDATRCNIKLPMPYLKKAPLDMSFSGLKSAANRVIQKHQSLNLDDDECVAFQRNFAALFQDHIMEYIVEKISKLLKFIKENDRFHDFDDIPCVPTAIVMAGGVASNCILRQKMDELGSKFKIPIKYPPPKYCVDNGVMVAWNGVERINNGFIQPPVEFTESNVGVEAYARWKLC